MLFDEHVLLLERLQVLETEISYLSARSAAAIKERSAAVSQALQSLADLLTAHARKEDEAIFPVLRAGLDMPSFWASIEREDRQLQEQLAGLEDALGEWLAAGWWRARGARTRFLAHGFGLLELLREHIRNEESFLNGYARRHLTVGDCEEIARRLQALADEAAHPALIR